MCLVADEYLGEKNAGGIEKGDAGLNVSSAIEAGAANSISDVANVREEEDGVDASVLVVNRSSNDENMPRNDDFITLSLKSRTVKSRAR